MSSSASDNHYQYRDDGAILIHQLTFEVIYIEHIILKRTRMYQNDVIKYFYM